MTILGNVAKWNAVKGKNLAVLYARIALGAAFLSGIASRFGLYGRDVGYGNFANFEKYTAEVNAFMPAFTIPFLAWAATAAELVFWCLVDRWDMAAPGLMGQRDLACVIWYRDDSFSGNQIAT
jgi:hypothetical protein